MSTLHIKWPLFASADDRCFEFSVRTFEGWLSQEEIFGLRRVQLEYLHLALHIISGGTSCGLESDTNGTINDNFFIIWMSRVSKLECGCFWRSEFWVQIENKVYLQHFICIPSALRVTSNVTICIQDRNAYFEQCACGLVGFHLSSPSAIRPTKALLFL